VAEWRAADEEAEGGLDGGDEAVWTAVLSRILLETGPDEATAIACRRYLLANVLWTLCFPLVENRFPIYIAYGFCIAP
jgi:hypothetical protein